MSEAQSLKFGCQICGEAFEAEPGAVVETGLGAVCACGECTLDGAVSEEEAAGMVEREEALDAEQLERMSEYELKEIGLTPEQRDELLKTGKTELAPMIICPKCQSEIFEETNEA